MEENIVWNWALTRKKGPSWGQNRIMKLYIGDKIMDINLDSLLLDSDSHAESGCIYFWRCRQAFEGKTWPCWCDLLVGDTENMKFLDLLSRGGLQIPL